MKQDHEEVQVMSTAEWYDWEKSYFSLNSPYRPHHFNTISISFRQTKFPDLCEKQYQ
ncbi:hypothetical protein [Alteribacter populi]|uniref:hypothetical protein n=1 Tax=Alteribacter populi TaxID=2011011 RepID=UPI0012FD526C|nr:hypothetical protein [Alteribacter populi]